MLSLHDIAHFYGNRLILKHISLSIPAGISLLIGPNGAGKTTLLSIMGGLITPTSGSVFFPDDCRVAMLGHNTFLYPELSGVENLVFWAKLYDVTPTEEVLEKALDTVGLASFGQERAGTYSRGMAQRLSLARLLLIKPDIMLLDEPGTGLDTLSLRMLHQIIQEKAQDGTTIVWVTHSVETDWTFADSIIRLENATITHHLPAPDYAVKYLHNHNPAEKQLPSPRSVSPDAKPTAGALSDRALPDGVLPDSAHRHTTNSEPESPKTSRERAGHD